MVRSRAELDSRRPGLLRRTERAATLVEYALLVAVFVVPASAGLSFMRDSAKSKMGHVAEQVAKSPTTTTTEAGDGGGGGGSSTSTTAAPTSTTTTVRPTGGSASPPTTTTSTPPTSTTVAKVAKTTAPTLTTSKSGSGGSKRWKSKRWKVDGSVKITDNTGAAVNGATVTFQVQEFDKYGKVTATTTVTATTSSSGNATLTVSNLTSSDRTVKVTVTNVTGLPAGTTWNGSSTNAQANRPAPW